MIRTHIDALGRRAADVRSERWVNVGIALRGFHEGKLVASIFDGGPIDTALPMGDIDAFDIDGRTSADRGREEPASRKNKPRNEPHSCSGPAEPQRECHEL